MSSTDFFVGFLVGVMTLVVVFCLVWFFYNLYHYQKFSVNDLVYFRCLTNDCLIIGRVVRVTGFLAFKDYSVLYIENCLEKIRVFDSSDLYHESVISSAE